MIQSLSPQDQKIIRRQLAVLPAQIDAAKQKEMGEMMSKLKEVSIISSSWHPSLVKAVADISAPVAGQWNPQTFRPIDR